MSRLIEYFENLDKKNFIMLILSVIIVLFIVVYYLNDYFTQKENFLITKKIELIKKIRNVRSMNHKVLKVKKRNKLLKTKLANLKSDLKYLISEIESSNILTVNDKKFLDILHKYLKVGENVNASFLIHKNKNLNKYNLNIYGQCDTEKFFDFCYLLKTIESPNAIININTLNISKKGSVLNYDLNVSIWSFE